MYDVCWKLINIGADIHHVNDGKKSVLYYSLELCNYSKQPNNENIRLTNYFITNKVHLNAILYMNNNTHLIHIILMGQLEIANKLIDNGANLDIKNDVGNTALMYACKHHYNVLVDKLILKGIDISLSNNDGDTAFNWACYSKNVEIVKLLLHIHNKADIYVISPKWGSAVESCLMNIGTQSFNENSATIIKLLLQCGYKLNDKGLTLLKRQLMLLKETITFIVQDPYDIMPLIEQ